MRLVPARGRCSVVTEGRAEQLPPSGAQRIPTAPPGGSSPRGHSVPSARPNTKWAGRRGRQCQAAAHPRQMCVPAEGGALMLALGRCQAGQVARVPGGWPRVGGGQARSKDLPRLAAEKAMGNLLLRAPAWTVGTPPLCALGTLSPNLASLSSHQLQPAPGCTCLPHPSQPQSPLAKSACSVH